MKCFAYVRTSNGKNREVSLQKQTGIIEDFMIKIIGT